MSHSSDSDGSSTQQRLHSSSPKYLLIIVDGTWTQAKRMLRNSPILLDSNKYKCQSIQFTSTNNKSIYDSIRKQPGESCLSTLESCERTLQLLEPTTSNKDMEMASHYLLSALKAMILIQMKYERIYLEKHPELVRNVDKLKAKKERQQQLLMMGVTSNSSSSSSISIPNNSISSLPKGYTIRSLKSGTTDATYVNSIWPYSTNTKSLVMIEKQITADNVNATKYYNGSATCLGIEYVTNDNNDESNKREELVACIIRHRNGSLGILHVDTKHRQLGLGNALLQTATRALLDRNEKVFAYIVDGNKASEALFSKLGWRKADPLGKRGTG